MRASRGMGAVMPSKMPGKKVIHRKDNPDDVDMYAKGGKVGGKGVVVTKGGTASAMAKKLLQKPGSLTAADMYAEGGKTKSKVNEAGNYTKPELRKRIFNSIKAAAVQGTGAGQWSARKAQLMAKRYKAAGGGYK
jgi:hypothetical protein